MLLLKPGAAYPQPNPRFGDPAQAIPGYEPAKTSTILDSVNPQTIPSQRSGAPVGAIENSPGQGARLRVPPPRDHTPPPTSPVRAAETPHTKGTPQANHEQGCSCTSKTIYGRNDRRGLYRPRHFSCLRSGIPPPRIRAHTESRSSRRGIAAIKIETQESTPGSADAGPPPPAGNIRT